MISECCKTFGINLDLAVEAHELLRGQTGQEIPGVTVNKEQYTFASVTTVKITEKSAEALMGKPCGNYITVEAPVIRENNRQAHHEVAKILSKHLGQIINLSQDASVLLIGLGNWNATPDALGPTVVKYSLVTRHLHNYAPEELHGGMRCVSALAPGVLGITGIETAEIIKGVVDKIKPDLIIAIDSLAARNVNRISTTIQLADTGINPGSGVGNTRKGINQETMGVRVIAIGVPTVVHAAIIVQDTFNQIFESISENPGLAQNFNINPEIVQQATGKVLEPFAGNLMVTPREVDDLIKETAKIIAGAISMSLHSSITADDYSLYLQ
ncbi:spore protease [Desulfofarcimen acetoxidans DSM 771]|uniref:Germination protease n=1 Tax=Desulfofarcimen acetoxidans (strain ATCC 49208 / DSM 771 / KCTC 5769 / VKM B-1644 / 5575) TaxID=485916 RepID=C8W569_DESAS|nr:GPR endopeptidase [Desulfofarcimen acetoxidans]ACV62051.1 spore protease [Desulfofarcimen acetoxidans DSM 771]